MEQVRNVVLVSAWKNVQPKSLLSNIIFVLRPSDVVVTPPPPPTSFSPLQPRFRYQKCEENECAVQVYRPWSRCL